MTTVVYHNRPCGFWCPRDPNEPPDTSHGICDECAQKLRDQSDARNWHKVPSYVEEREKFEDYKEKRRGIKISSK